MLENTKRTRSFLGAGAASTLLLGLAVVVGIVPLPDDATAVSTAQAGLPSVALPVVESGPEVVPGATSTTATTPPPPPPPTTTAPIPVEPAPPEPPPSTVPEPEPAASPAEAPPAPGPPGATAVARRQPSEAEVQQAVAGVQPYVSSILPVNPTRAQVDELGGNICTAFDEGQTTAQIKATGAELVKKVPFASLRPGGDDYIVGTAVALYCPGHTANLG